MRKLWVAFWTGMLGLGMAAGAAELSPDAVITIRKNDVAAFTPMFEKNSGNMEFGQKALRAATVDGAADIVKYLVEKGVDIESAPDAGMTALHHAASYGHLEIVKYLLEKKADVDARDSLSHTPLHFALQAKNAANRIAITKMLLENGADVNASAITGMTAFMLVNSVKPYNPELVKMILAAKPDVNARDKQGKTALYHCLVAYAGNTMEFNPAEWQIPAAMAEVPGIDLNIADNNGLTVIHYAAANIRKESAVPYIQTLAKKGADINARDKHGETPLLMAIKNSHPENTAVLLSLKADVNIADNGKICPVILAAQRGNLPLLQVLVEQHNANLNVSDSQRYTPLQYAATNGRAEIVSYLLGKGVSAEQKKAVLIYMVSRNGNPAILKALIDNGTDVSGTDFYGNTALHYAARANNRNLVTVLLNAKADVNAVNKEGKTPLFNAVARRDMGMVKLLLQNGADKNIADKKGKKAADYANGDLKKLLQ